MQQSRKGRIMEQLVNFQVVSGLDILVLSCAHLIPQACATASGRRIFLTWVGRNSRSLWTGQHQSTHNDDSWTAGWPKQRNWSVTTFPSWYNCRDGPSPDPNVIVSGSGVFHCTNSFTRSKSRWIQANPGNGRECKWVKVILASFSAIWQIACLPSSKDVGFSRPIFLGFRQRKIWCWNRHGSQNICRYRDRYERLGRSCSHAVRQSLRETRKGGRGQGRRKWRGTNGIAGRIVPSSRICGLYLFLMFIVMKSEVSFGYSTGADGSRYWWVHWKVASKRNLSWHVALIVTERSWSALTKFVLFIHLHCWRSVNRQNTTLPIFQVPGRKIVCARLCWYFRVCTKMWHCFKERIKLIVARKMFYCPATLYIWELSAQVKQTGMWQATRSKVHTCWNASEHEQISSWNPGPHLFFFHYGDSEIHNSILEILLWHYLSANLFSHKWTHLSKTVFLVRDLFPLMRSDSWKSKRPLWLCIWFSFLKNRICTVLLREMRFDCSTIWLWSWWKKRHLEWSRYENSCVGKKFVLIVGQYAKGRNVPQKVRGDLQF